jgi:hypothetical protein
MASPQASAATTREELIRTAALHQSGKLEEPAAVYLAFLQTNQHNPEALHYLGLTLHHFSDLRRARGRPQCAATRRTPPIHARARGEGSRRTAWLQPHGRYVHTETYVRNTLGATGFEVIDVKKEALRREGSSTCQ